ncbi:hypothetical protein QJS04_geneDACA010967 [Acorus gramineus]|uniref:Uncharacterized protein n=1 Tax=Acorus gramineus TaxID=55184 RepID=A0AAV9BH73_ACOGR|nr:hypothetical protein QJS04_geneDACA010967 [Acorus gramineus]
MGGKPKLEQAAKAENVLRVTHALIVLKKLKFVIQGSDARLVWETIFASNSLCS